MIDIPCKCGIPFTVLPREFHPDSKYSKVVWRRMRGDGFLQMVGNPAQMEGCIPPGDWDVCNSLGDRHRMVLRYDFKICRAYSPDNLSYIESVAKERGLV